MLLIRIAEPTSCVIFDHLVNPGSALRTKSVHHSCGASIAPNAVPGDALHDSGEGVRARRLRLGYWRLWQRGRLAPMLECRMDLLLTLAV